MCVNYIFNIQIYMYMYLIDIFILCVSYTYICDLRDPMLLFPEIYFIYISSSMGGIIFY